ncbi:hypothetical protein Tco_1056512 [Tanacetum coccineum]|uniref:Uncharacterized protein n=1 Tax=Tanacetum coccineum TaxID=301880 RepID=A0ABQ5H466_9ASTR
MELMNMTQLCDIDPMIDDLKVLARSISLWKSRPAGSLSDNSTATIAVYASSSRGVSDQDWMLGNVVQKMANKNRLDVSDQIISSKKKYHVEENKNFGLIANDKSHDQLMISGLQTSV